MCHFFRTPRSDRQDSEPPGITHPCATPGPGPPHRVPTNRLIPHRIPVQFLEPTDRLCPFPQPTPHNGATGWPDPRKMSRSDLPRKMNTRISDSEVRGLIRSRVLWYVPVQAKRPFEFPIPDLSEAHLKEMEKKGILPKGKG